MAILDNLTNTTETLLSAKLIKVLQTRLVAKRICTLETNTEIKRKGEAVDFPSLASPTVKTYDGTVVFETLSDAVITLTVDQAEYVAVKFGDIELFQSSIDAKGATAEQAGYKLADSMDKYILGLYTEAGISYKAGANVTVNSSNVLEVISDIAIELEENNVPNGQSWIVLAPWLKQKLLLAGVKFGINEGMAGEKGGLAWVKYNDLDIYISNNVPTTETLGLKTSQIMSGMYNSIAFVEQITETKIDDNPQDYFGYEMKSLAVYGGKVIRPDALLHAVLEEIAEA